MNQLELIQNPWKSRQSSARVVILQVNNPAQTNNSLDITQIENLNHLQQAIDLSNAFQDALVPTSSEFGNNTLRFDISRGLQIANHLIPKAVTIDDKYSILTQSNNQVGIMVDRVTLELKTLFGISLSHSVSQQLTAAIRETFTNLNIQKNSAWIFWGKTTSAQTNYTYNILFAIQNAETGHFMAAIPMGFEITAYAVKEKVLFFTIKDYASYSVKIEGIKVAQPLSDENNKTFTGVYNIVSALNNKSVINMSTISYNNVDHKVNLWEKTNTNNQNWAFIYDKNKKAYQIENLFFPGLVLAWNNYGDSNVAFATLNKKYAEHYWILQAAGNNYFYLVNMKNTNLVLDVSNSNNSNGTNVIVHQKNGGTNQKFSIQENHGIQSGTYQLVTALNNSSVVDLNQSNNNVTLWSNNQGNNQKWNFIYDSTKSAYQIKNVANESLVLTWTYYSSDSDNIAAISNQHRPEQYWLPEYIGAGYYRFKNYNNPQGAMDVKGAGTKNGTNILYYSYHGSNNQNFKLLTVK
uniref:Insecticidal crystal protein 6 n=1 Tax=Bacillus thuringiensis TaxID=1428 RepID=A0A1B0QWT8_BACTU|nr:insecticidal crystal protein 6 [Bacillus thuringiensis]